MMVVREGCDSPVSKLILGSIRVHFLDEPCKGLQG